MLASSSSAGVGPAVGVIILIGMYFLPTGVALARNVTNRGSVIVVNFFLGWTFIGWVVSLAMACRTNTLSR